jgi:hypothetical protein
MLLSGREGVSGREKEEQKKYLFKVYFSEMRRG